MIRRLLGYSTYQLTAFGVAGALLFALTAAVGSGPAVSRDVFELAIAMDPHYAAGQRIVGEEMVREGRLLDGLEHLRRARESDPHDGTICLPLARAARKAETRTEALAAFECAVVFAPTSPDAWEGLGGVALEQGAFPRAIEATTRALALDPNRNELRLNLGTALARQGDLAGAERVFAEAVRRNPEDAQLAFNLALALRKRGDTPQAAQWLERAVALDPRSSRAWFHLATLEAQRGNLQRAREAAEHLVALEPQDEQARALLEKLSAAP